MPPIITLAPILADPADNARQSSWEINPFIFVKGSFVYQVLQQDSDSALRIFKSTAGGVNSAVLDVANAPSVHQTSFVCYSDPASSIIRIAYVPASGTTIEIVDFTCGPDTYGTPIVSTLTTHVVTQSGFHGAGLFFRPGSGLYYFSYVSNASGKLEYVTIASDGTTSAAVVLASAESINKGLLRTAFDEVTGIAFLFYLVSTAGGHLNCVTLSATDVIGTPVNLGTDGAAWVDVVVQSGVINIAWVNGDTSNGTKVYTSSATVAAAPTFSAAVTLVTVVAPEIVSYVSITFITGVLTVLWCLTDLSFDPGVDEIDYSQFVSSAWTPPATFYDAVANPPAGGLPYPSQFLHTLQVLGITGGWFGFTAMETEFCTGFILVAPVSPLSLACPIGGGTATVGIAYDAFLVVSGDTPPDEFVIASGALPPGITLNMTTGEISGVPTESGTSNFTIEITDSLDHTATTDPGCQIVVSAAPPVPPPVLPCPTLFDVLGPDGPDILINEPYSVNLVVVPGNSPPPGTVAPYVLTVTAGALPTGITLTGSTLSGTPTVAGTYNFTVTATDANELTTSRAFSIMVSNPPAQL